MNKSKYLGEFEIVVLGALLQLAEDAYGISILAEIEKRAGRAVTIGALYSTLNRLEKKGYIEARVGEATPERGGRAKRYFDITAEGRKQLSKSLNALHNMLGDLSVWPGGALVS